MHFGVQVKPDHEAFYVKVLKVPEGFQPFLVRTGPGRARRDMLPLLDIPAMPTYQQAEELAIVVAWQWLDTFKNEDQEPIVGPMD
jgi:hypothetical protein